MPHLVLNCSAVASTTSISRLPSEREFCSDILLNSTLVCSMAKSRLFCSILQIHLTSSWDNRNPSCTGKHLPSFREILEWFCLHLLCRLHKQLLPSADILNAFDPVYTNLISNSIYHTLSKGILYSGSERVVKCLCLPTIFIF